VDRRQFERYLRRYKDTIAAIARKFAGRDDDLAEELRQEGLIALWNVKPARAVKNKDAYIRQALKFRMVDHLRRLRPKQFDSLDRMLEAGEQLERDSATGAFRISRSSGPTRVHCEPAEEGN